MPIRIGTAIGRISVEQPEMESHLQLHPVYAGDPVSAVQISVSEAESGNTIVTTRHNELVAKLIPAHPQHVHRGKDVGKGGIKPALKRGTKLPYLEVLWEDRGDR